MKSVIKKFTRQSLVELSSIVGCRILNARCSMDGEVLRADGSAVAGLYAAGACAANIAEDGKNYSSGTQLGEGSFFGRRAGAHAARR